MRDNWNSHVLLTEMQNGLAILKNYLAVSYTIKYIYLQYDSAISLLGIYPNVEKFMFTEKLI